MPMLLLGCLAAAAVPAGANDYQRSARQLEAVRERIQEVEAGLRERQERRASVVAELRDLERAIGEAASRLEEIDERLAESSARAADLADAVAAEEEAVAEQRSTLRAAVREAYISGRQRHLRLLLDADAPAALDRLLVYFEYAGEARSQRIREAVAAVERYRSMREDLRRERERLAELRREQAAQRERLQARREERSSVLARVEAAIGADEQRLERLEANEAELQALVDELRDALADVPGPEADRPSIEERRGTLPWPVDGALAARFGEARGSGGTWRGLLVRGGMGDRVEAVAHGQVVFADWLRGLGLLLIIDHGDGYMTLYGYNQSLYREVGEWVDTGDMIARVGDSGGRDEAGLYFEIRKQGQPQDPLRWLE